MCDFISLAGIMCFIVCHVCVLSGSYWSRFNLSGYCDISNCAKWWLHYLTNLTFPHISGVLVYICRTDVLFCDKMSRDYEIFSDCEKWWLYCLIQDFYKHF